MSEPNTISEYSEDRGIDSGELNLTSSADQSLPTKVDSGPRNPIARLEDEIQNSSFFHMEIQNKHGNSIAPNVALEDDGGVSCADEILEKILKNKNQFHIAEENAINHQEWTSFQQGGGEEDNEVFMSNLSYLDNGPTERDYASEAVDLNRVKMNSDAPSDIVEDVCNGLQNKVLHLDEEGIQRDFTIQAEINANLSNRFRHSEAKGKIVHSMFRNDYKKKPFFKKFRNMNNSARISSMREGILAHRWSFCVASAPVNHICSSQKGVDEPKDPAVVDHTEGNATNNKSETKTLIFGKKRFLQKALLDSAKRLQAQKMLRSGVYDGLSIPRDEIDANNNMEGNSSKEMNQTPLNIVKCESESYSERKIEQKRRRREQFKKPLVGKSREKTKEIAERVVAVQRSQILQSKRDNISFVSGISNYQVGIKGAIELRKVTGRIYLKLHK